MYILVYSEKIEDIPYWHIIRHTQCISAYSLLRAYSIPELQLSLLSASKTGGVIYHWGSKVPHFTK